jgi:hypothetical protein
MSREPKKWAGGRAAILLCTMVCVSGATDSKPPKEMAEEAITLSGRHVTLYKDGSWEYKKIKDPNEILFRNIPWGLTADEVKRRMKDKPAADNDRVIVFPDRVGSLTAHCCFALAGGRFVRGQYRFAEEHANDNLFLDDFDAIDGLLSKKYGKPAENKRVWRDDLYKDDRTEWGMAVKTGRLIVYSTWKMGKVRIAHGLSGDNYEVEHVIEYTQDDMEILESSIREQEDQDKL